MYNDNGLTLVRWARAAGIVGPITKEQVTAWYRGDDPSDWRAEAQRDKKKELQSK